METKNDLALQSVQSYIVEVGGVQVILDADIASLYGWKPKELMKLSRIILTNFPMIICLS